ncbi:hypothetical protein LCL97_12155 [Seohaeicola saemankumensis]|nr:DUF6629 family protein [Seohaeicola saemankumensis]MCA0871583.1 hypothetical protein [Seohaeicola saemankumensis]
MCFSAEASFVLGTGLVVCGGATLRSAFAGDRRYAALAGLPLFFGIQQISEGVLWLRLDAGSAGNTELPMLIFLLFAYWFWPVWVPLSAALVEPRRRKQRTFALCSMAGAILGGALFLPVLLHPEVLSISIVRHSIQYSNPEMFPYDGAKLLARAIYAAIICIPLLLSSVAQVRVFGWLILGSVIFGFLFLSYAFTSVWCFLAAVLSAYIYIVLRRTPRPAT